MTHLSHDRVHLHNRPKLWQEQKNATPRSQSEKKNLRFIIVLTVALLWGCAVHAWPALVIGARARSCGVAEEEEDETRRDKKKEEEGGRKMKKMMGSEWERTTGKERKTRVVLVEERNWLKGSLEPHTTLFLIELLLHLSRHTQTWPRVAIYGHVYLLEQFIVGKKSHLLAT